MMRDKVVNAQHRLDEVKRKQVVNSVEVARALRQINLRKEDLEQRKKDSADAIAAIEAGANAQVAVIREEEARQKVPHEAMISKHDGDWNTWLESGDGLQSQYDEKVELQRALLDLQHSIIREIEHAKYVLRIYETDLFELQNTSMGLDTPTPEFLEAEELEEVQNVFDLYDVEGANALKNYTRENPQPEEITTLKVLQRLDAGHFQDSVAFTEHFQSLTEAHFRKFGVPLTEFNKAKPAIHVSKKSYAVARGRVILYLGLFDPSDFPASAPAE